MSSEITRTRTSKSGEVVQIMPDGSERVLSIPPLRAMTEEEAGRAALSDPDAVPPTPEDYARMERVPRVKVIRQALHMTQEEFAACFHVPLGALRDWEQDRGMPDEAVRAYLRVIARNPKAVLEALEPLPEPGR